VFPWWVLADDGKNMIDGGMRRLAEKLSDERR
jgi:hypothetical protein